MLPEWAFIRPSSSRMVVVLPDPLGPEEPVHRALRDGEADLVDGDVGAETPSQPLRTDGQRVAISDRGADRGRRLPLSSWRLAGRRDLLQVGAD